MSGADPRLLPGGVPLGVLADGQLPVPRGPQHDRGGQPLEALQVGTGDTIILTI